MQLKKIFYPKKGEWGGLIKRAQLNTADLDKLCEKIFGEVQVYGDKALLSYTEMFDGVSLSSLLVSEKEIEESLLLVSSELKEAIQTAKNNISTFHTAQKSQTITVETMPGITCRQVSRAIERIGIYIPGGTAPLFSTVLMLAVPAQIAGCKDIIMCSPPDKDGKINPVILWTAQLCGVTKIIKAGGAQAIAAMCVGTESVPMTYKIFGPGNQYVMAAKQYAQKRGTAIDMPAGPSEVLIIADETAKPDFIAADMLSQAEHGADSQSILLCNNEAIIPLVEKAINRQLNDLPRKELIEKSLQNSSLVVLNDIEQCISLSNLYAPEHLILSVANYNKYIDLITNAGSVFLGNYSPESVGDYASGTNHTLPTSAYARSYSGVNMDTFYKKITFQELTKDGLDNIADTVIIMAENEQLSAHANAVRIRQKKLKS